MAWRSLLKGLTMWYLIWRTNKTFFSSAIHHCLPITVFVLLMGDGVFSHSREWMRGRVKKHWFAPAGGFWRKIRRGIRVKLMRKVFDFWRQGPGLRKEFSYPYHPNSDATPPKCPMKKEKSSFLIVCAEHPSQTSPWHSSFTPKLLQKTVQVSLGLRRLKVFICGCIETCHIQASLPQKCSRTRSSAQQNNEANNSIQWKAKRRRKLLPFSAWQQRKLF